jgi:CRISPR/Cas system CSM-associated protein Csm3 (group 7 of RAMP superfamily)
VQIKVADAEGNAVSFRKLLLNRCQKEFEKEKEDEEKFVEKIKQLEGLPVGTNSCNGQGRILVEIVGQVEKILGKVQLSSSPPPWKVRA